MICVYRAEDKRWEDGWTAVVLLSLVGVNCVITNQWYSTLREGTQDCERLLQSEWAYTRVIRAVGSSFVGLVRRFPSPDSYTPSLLCHYYCCRFAV